MTYVNPFNATIMPGTTQAKLIDDFSRQMYAALIERFNDKFVVDATADPWNLKNSITGLQLAKSLTIPFNHFLTRGGGSVLINDSNVQASGDSGPLLGSFSLPVGVTIRSAGVYMISTNPVNLELYKVTGAPPFTKSSIAAWSQAGGAQIVSGNGTTLSEITDGLATYYISVDLVSSNPVDQVAVYGARVIYDTPSHLNTI